RQEGERALAMLASMPRPRLDDHASRNTYRALARAHEGAGHDADALKSYSDFVDFGSGFQRCSGCHQLAGPRDASFFRDWWAGRRFGVLAWKTGRAPSLIEAAEATLADDPDSLLARIRLGYLYEAGGDAARANRLWAQLDPSAERRLAVVP